MSDEKISLPPAANLDDAGHALAKGLIGAIPIVGSPAAEIFTLIFAPSLEKRRDVWLGELAKAVYELQSKHGLDIKRLQSDDQFVSLVLNATQVALRNHHALKLSFLRQAIVSGFSLGDSFADDEAHLFVRLIDELSPRQLKFVANVRAYSALDGHVAGVFLAGESINFDTKEADWIAAPLEKELISRGLYEINGQQGSGRMCLSELGYRFMIFLSGEESHQDREWMNEQRRFRVNAQSRN
ncbi:MAG TPA: hypothetical protein VHB46_07505 [Burkholderiales bacterium]|nr:hypothetical protein [Burkholderiales bacterium]